MKCKEEGCNKESWAKQMCGTHYRRVQRATKLHLRSKEVARTKKWRESNSDKLAEQQVVYYEKHKERLSAYRSQWKRDNWDTYKAYLAARKGRVKQATPKWVDLKAIEQFYKNCPKGYHVDHHIPLNGKEVSGLHVLENLRYLLASENLKKSNKF